MKSLLLFFLFFFYQFCFTQNNLLIINTSVENGLTVCENNVLFEIDIENPSPFNIINDTVTITLPTGVEYVPSSVSNGIEYDITNLNQPIIVISDIASLTSYTFSIDLTAVCEVESYLLGGGQLENVVDFNFQSTNGISAPANNSQSETSAVYSVAIPNLSITSISNQSYNATVGDIFSRCITIVNGGSGSLSAFSLQDDHSPAILISGISTGTLTPVATGDLIEFIGADFTGIGNGNNLFDPGESIIVCETVEILSCQGATSDFTYWWGCNGENCQVQTDAANINFPGEVPDLQFVRNSSYTTSVLNNNCYGNNVNGDFEASLEISNSGTGVAYDVEIDLFQGWSLGMAANYYSSLNTSSFTISINGAPAVPLTFDATFNSQTKSCLPANPIGRVVFTVDSITPTDVVLIEWNHYTCCHDDVCTNTERKHLLGWRFEGTYRNSCFQDYPIPLTQGVYTGYFRNTLVLDNSVGTLLGTSSGNVSFLSSNFEFPLPRNTANDMFIYQAILPPCLDIDLNSFALTSASGTALAAPDSNVVNGDTVNFYYNAPIGGVQSTVSFDVLLDCGSCTTTGPQTISINTIYIPDLACNCQMKMGCETAEVELICPTLCEGANLMDATVIRGNFGLPDNDNNGLPDAVGTVDMSLVKTTRLMYGDTLDVTQEIYVNNPNNLNFTHFNSQSLITDVGTRFTFEGGDLIIYDASTGLYYNCLNPTLVAGNTTIGASVQFTEDIDILTQGLCLPATFTRFDTGDSILWTAKYSVTSNIGGNIISGNVENTASLSTMPLASAAPADLFGCNTITKNFTLIGYYWTNYGPDVYNVQDCNPITIRQNYYLSIGICCNNYAGGNLFPFEYRNWGSPSFLNVVMPDDYTYLSARFNFIRTSGTLASTASPWFNINPSSIVGNSYDFDLTPYFGDDAINDSILLGDDGFHGTLEVTFEPNCNVADSTGLIGYYWDFDQVNQLITSNTAPISNVTNQDEITYYSPLLNLQTNLVSVNTSNGEVDWLVTVTNSSNLSTGSNLWIAAPTTGTVIADSLVDLSTNTSVYPNANGIFNLNQIGPATSLDYRLYTHITGCQPDSVLLYFGWGCTGVPLQIEDYECELSSTKLTIIPLFPELENTISIISNDTIPLCDIAEYEITIRNFQLGNAYNIINQIILPNGMTIIPGSCQFAYNSGLTPIPDPTLITGSTFQWDINSLSATLQTNGLIGISDPTLNFIKIRFQVNTDCFFTSGNRVNVQSWGEAFCGRPEIAIPTLSDKLFITDALPPYEATIALNIDFITPCAGGSVLEVTVTNNGPQAFDVSDSITLALWPGVTYTPGSFVGIQNAPNSTSSISTVNGYEEISWHLPSGIAVGDSSTFQINLDATPEALLCGIIQISAAATTSGTSICNSTACNISVVTGDTTRNIFIYKGYLDLSNSVATSAPNPPSGETVNLSFDIFNSGETIAPGTLTTVQFYDDADGNGVLSTTDPLIGTDTFTDQLLTNSTFNYSSTLNFDSPSTCSIIAVIDTADNPCICSPQQILIPIELLSPTLSFQVCSGENIQIGADSISLYSYTWQNTANLDNSQLAQPIFTITNIYPATDTLTYVRDISKIGCVTADTSEVIIFSIPIPEAGNDQNLCGLYTTDLEGDSPLGTSTGIWAEDLTFGNPSTVFFADATDAETNISGLVEGSYRLVWTLFNGPCTSVSDTVEINVYDAPVSIAGTDQQLCDNYTTILDGNILSGTATGIWTEDLTFGNPSAVVFGNDSDPQSSATVITEGDYSFIWTVSNGSCASETDTVIISMFDQPIATAGADQNLCATYTTILDGNLPLGTTNGYWIENTAFGNPSAVTFADSSVSTTTISGLQEGTYSLIWVIENGNCMPSLDTVLINIYDNPVAYAGLDENLCGVSTTTMTANSALGTSTGFWTEDPTNGNPSAVTFADVNNESTAISGLQEGTYKLVWTVSNGNCVDETDTVKIEVYDAPISVAGPDQDLCNTYTTTLAATPAVGLSSGLWYEVSATPSVVFTNATNPTTTISGLQEGSFTLVWMVSNGTCSPAFDTIVVNVYDTPVSLAGADQDLCDVFTTDLTVDNLIGTSTGIWSEDMNFGNPSAVTFTYSSINTTTVSNLQEGTYQLIWTVSNGNCPSNEDTVLLNVYDAPVALAGVDQFLCESGNTTLSGNTPAGSASGNWSLDANFNNPSTPAVTTSTNPTTTISGLVEGTYQLLWTVSNGTCADVQDTVQITIYNQPTADAGIDQDLCNIYTATLAGSTPAGTATGEWTQDLTQTPPSTIIITDVNDPLTTISGLQEGTYHLVWTVSNGNCVEALDTMIINVFDTPISNAGLDIFLCNEVLTYLDADETIGTSLGHWETDPTYTYPSFPNIVNSTDSLSEVNNLVIGDYPVIWVVENGNCPAAYDTVIIVNQELPIVQALYPLEVCSNLCLSIENLSTPPTGETISNFVWEVNGQNYFNNIEEICIDQPGDYEVKLIVTASNGCIDSLVNNPLFTVNPSPIAGFEISPDNIIIELDRVDVTSIAQGDIIEYIYNMGDSNSFNQENFFHFYENFGNYTINQFVENQFGCRDSISMEIEVDEKHTIFIPNSFTPNGDGINDYFGPVVRGVRTDNYTFMVFNRWGEIIFEANDFSTYWDGIVGGLYAPEGSYIWKIEYMIEGRVELFDKKGHVVLIR